MVSKKHTKHNREIYFGFDDSNHGGQNAQEEIIVIVASEHQPDFLHRRFPNRRDLSLASRSFGQHSRRYYFTTLPKDSRFSAHFNLPLLAPSLIRHYLEEHPGIEPYKIYLGFDGPVLKNWREVLEQDFPEYDLEIEIFTGRTKRNCSLPVYLADTLANDLFRRSFGEVVSDSEHFVPIRLEEIAERIPFFQR
jgi:hypothetical protein